MAVAWQNIRKDPYLTAYYYNLVPDTNVCRAFLPLRFTGSLIRCKFDILVKVECHSGRVCTPSREARNRPHALYERFVGHTCTTTRIVSFNNCVTTVKLSQMIPEKE